MFADFLQSLVQFAEFLWPLKIVHQWERGLYLLRGRVVTPWRWVAFSSRKLDGPELQPGLYLAIPWFSDVHAASIAWDFVESGRLDLSLRDGRLLSCEAVAKMRVVDIQKAYLHFHDYERDRRQMVRATVAEMLAEADPERFTPEKRGRLLGSSLLKAVRDGADDLGHEAAGVQVTTFILGSRTIRLLSDHNGIY